MITKEVCYKALNQLQAYASQNGGKFEQEHEILSKLIKQHFDNPPLSFEELKPGMWVWDNELKIWDKIFDLKRCFDTKKEEICEPYYVVTYAREFKFEENTYYRKQV